MNEFVRVWKALYVYTDENILKHTYGNMHQTNENMYRL
jgi:hypothetical protein